MNLITNINNASWLLQTLGIPPDDLTMNHGSVDYRYGMVSIWEGGRYEVWDSGSGKRAYGNIYDLYKEVTK